MRRVSTVLLFVFAVLATPAWAGPEQVEIDVSDLVLERPGPAVFPVGWRVLHSNAMLPSQFIMGEADLLCGLEDSEGTAQVQGHVSPLEVPPVAAIVDADALLRAVAAASKVAANTLSIEEGLLKVDLEDAPVVRAALAELRHANPAAVRLEVRLEATEGTDRSETLFAASESVRFGMPTVLADAVMTNVLTDYEVEIAQACVIANPVVQARRTGASLLTRIQPLPSGDRAIVEAVLRVAEPLPERPIDLGHPGFGPLDRCLTGFEEIAVTFVAENGKPTEQLWTGRQGRLLRFTLTASWTAAEGDRLLWSGLLAQPVLGFRNMHCVLPHPELVSEEGRRPAPVRRDLQGALAGGEERTATDATRLEVDVLLVPAGAPVLPNGPPPDGARELARARAHVTEGLSACFNGSREQLYLVDWDVEVAQAARVPDPIVGPLQEGHFLEVTVLSRGVIDLDLQLLRLARIDRIVMPLDVAQTSAGVQGNISSTGTAGDRRPSGSIYTGPSMPQDTVALEQPSVHSLRITAEIPLGRDGTGMLRRSARGFTGEAKDIVVVVRSPSP